MALMAAFFSRPRPPRFTAVDEAYTYLSTTSHQRHLRAAARPRPPLWLRILDREPPLQRLQRVLTNPHTPSDLLTSFADDPELAPLVASHPSTPPEVLARLFHTHCRGFNHLPVWGALVSNPTTPDHLLFDIVDCGHPATFLPALLSRPSLPNELLLDVAGRIARIPHAGVAAAHSLVRRGDAPVEALLLLAAGPSPSLRSALADQAAQRNLPALRLALRLAQSGLYVSDPSGLVNAVGVLLDSDA